MPREQPPSIPVDYDSDPGRGRAAHRATALYSMGDDVYEEVAARLASGGHGTVVDVGCGTGALMALLERRTTGAVGLDSSPTQLSRGVGARVLGDARRLPFADGSLGGAAALYMLYHLPDPAAAIAECHRVLRPGGLFIACSPSRRDDPELVGAVPEYAETFESMSFDSDCGPALVESIFGNVEVERWDEPDTLLPDRAAVELYLYGHGLPKARVADAATRVATPLMLTKRGAVIYAYKRET